jgi:hypothetical protein
VRVHAKLLAKHVAIGAGVGAGVCVSAGAGASDSVASHVGSRKRGRSLAFAMSEKVTIKTTLGDGP